MKCNIRTIGGIKEVQCYKTGYKNVVIAKWMNIVIVSLIGKLELPYLMTDTRERKMQWIVCQK